MPRFSHAAAGCGTHTARPLPFRPENNSPFFRHYFTRVSLLCLDSFIICLFSEMARQNPPFLFCFFELLHTGPLDDWPKNPINGKPSRISVLYMYVALKGKIFIFHKYCRIPEYIPAAIRIAMAPADRIVLYNIRGACRSHPLNPYLHQNSTVPCQKNLLRLALRVRFYL